MEKFYKKELLKSQKNWVFLFIESKGGKPSEFQWGEALSRYMSKTIIEKIVYKNTDFFCEFDFDGNRNVLTFSPGEESEIARSPKAAWSGVQYYFSVWYYNLMREITQPDLWEELLRQQVSSDFDIDSDKFKEKFTPNEIGQLRNALHEIKRYIKDNIQTEISEERYAVIMQRFDLLEDKMEKSSRREWLFLLIGILVPTAVQFGLNFPQLQAMFEIVKNALGIGKHLLPFIL